MGTDVRQFRKLTTQGIQVGLEGGFEQTGCKRMFLRCSWILAHWLLDNIKELQLMLQSKIMAFWWFLLRWYLRNTEVLASEVL